jgi:hypothetical protein
VCPISEIVEVLDTEQAKPTTTERAMSNARAIFTRVVLWSLAGATVGHQVAAILAEPWMVRHHEPEWWRYVSPIPVPWLTLILAPAAITAAVLTARKLGRRGRSTAAGTILASALVAGGAALAEVIFTPLALFAYDLGEREFAWWMNPTLVILTNGFLQGCLVSMLMMASAKERPSAGT